MTSLNSVDRIALKLLSQREKRVEQQKTIEKKCQKIGQDGMKNTSHTLEGKKDFKAAETGDKSEPFTNARNKTRCRACGADLQFSAKLSLFNRGVSQTYCGGPFCSKCSLNESLKEETVYIMASQAITKRHEALKRWKEERLAARMKAIEEQNQADDTPELCMKISQPQVRQGNKETQCEIVSKKEKEQIPKIGQAFLCLKCGTFYSSQLFLEKHFSNCKGCADWQVIKQKPRVSKTGKLEYLCPMCSILYFQRPSFFRHVVRCFSKKVKEKSGSDRDIDLKVDVRRYVDIETLLKDLKQQCRNLGICDLNEEDNVATKETLNEATSPLVTSAMHQSSHGQSEGVTGKSTVKDSISVLPVLSQNSPHIIVPGSTGSAPRKSSQKTVLRYRKRKSSQTSSDSSKDFWTKKVSPPKIMAMVGSNNVGVPTIKLPRTLNCNVENPNSAIVKQCNAPSDKDSGKRISPMQIRGKQRCLTVVVRRKLLKTSQHNPEHLSTTALPDTNESDVGDNLRKREQEQNGAKAEREESTVSKSNLSVTSCNSGCVDSETACSETKKVKNNSERPKSEQQPLKHQPTPDQSNSKLHEAAEKLCSPKSQKSKTMNQSNVDPVKPIVLYMRTGDGLLQCPICKEIYFRFYHFKKHAEHCQPVLAEEAADSTEGIVKEDPV